MRQNAIKLRIHLLLEIKEILLNFQNGGHLGNIGHTIFKSSNRCLFVWFDALHPSQQLWSCLDGQFT